MVPRNEERAEKGCLAQQKDHHENVLVAVTVMVVSGIVIWAFDQVAMLIVQTLMKIGG